MSALGSRGIITWGVVVVAVCVGEVPFNGNPPQTNDISRDATPTTHTHTLYTMGPSAKQWYYKYARDHHWIPKKHKQCRHKGLTKIATGCKYGS